MEDVDFGVPDGVGNNTAHNKTSYDGTANDTTAYDKTDHDETVYEKPEYDQPAYDHTAFDSLPYDHTTYDKIAYDGAALDSTVLDKTTHDIAVDQAGPFPGEGADNDGTGLRILVENSEYWLRNHGDLAMMQVTVNRLRTRWPRARIAVLTDSPVFLMSLIKGVEGISVFDDDPWAAPTLGERLAARCSPAVVGPFALGMLRARVWFPQKMRGARNRTRRAWRRLTSNPTPVVPAVAKPRTHSGSMAAVAASSLLLVMGGGYLTDADVAQSNRVFNLMEHARRNRVRVALVGQGLGPIDEPNLRQRASDALTTADFIALRERRRGPQLLEALGVASEKVMVTGDDAIELAHSRRRDEIGGDIGLCLRVAGYSPVTVETQAEIGAVVRRAAAEHDAWLAPLVIAEYRSQDRKSTIPLVSGYPRVRDLAGRYSHPVETIDRVGRCRVVVTGAYHLAVFALSQGIPVIALTSTDYYDDKFLGLADMFGVGMTVLDLRDPQLTEQLSTAIADSWRSAPDVRDRLRARAAEQIELSRMGFGRVYGLAGTDRSQTSPT